MYINTHSAVGPKNLYSYPFFICNLLLSCLIVLKLHLDFREKKKTPLKTSLFVSKHPNYLTINTKKNKKTAPSLHRPKTSSRVHRSCSAPKKKITLLKDSMRNWCVYLLIYPKNQLNLGKYTIHWMSQPGFGGPSFLFPKAAYFFTVLNWLTRI